MMPINKLDATSLFSQALTLGYGAAWNQAGSTAENCWINGKMAMSAKLIGNAINATN